MEGWPGRPGWEQVVGLVSTPSHHLQSRPASNDGVELARVGI